MLGSKGFRFRRNYKKLEQNIDFGQNVAKLLISTRKMVAFLIYGRNSVQTFYHRNIKYLIATIIDINQLITTFLTSTIQVL